MIVSLSQVTTQDIDRLRQEIPLAFAEPTTERLAKAAIWLALAALTVFSLIALDIYPARIWNGLGELMRIAGLMLPPVPGEHPEDLLWAVLETVAMAFLGTFIACIFAIPLGFMAARNVIPTWILRLSVRRSLDCLRGIDQLVWALIFVRAVGLGPLAGILAIIISDTGTLGKLFSEAIENVDRKPMDGVAASGGNRPLVLRFGVLPQVLPIFLSNALYIFESNIRSATILGIVGAGGIGFHLADRIRALRWDEASFIILLVLVTVAMVDFLSKKVRAALIGGQPWQP